MLVLGKFLYFAKGTTAPDAVGESILYPAESFKGGEPTANTTLRLYFLPRITGSNVEDEHEKIDLTIKILEILDHSQQSYIFGNLD